MENGKEGFSLKRPSHAKLKLANLCWENSNWCMWMTNNTLANCWRQIEFVSTSRQQRANMLLCCSHTSTWVCQHELVNISLTCEGPFSILIKFLTGLQTSNWVLAKRSWVLVGRTCLNIKTIYSAVVITIIFILMTCLCYYALTWWKQFQADHCWGLKA